MANVLIADDHAMIRAGLRYHLEQDRSVATIGESTTGAETLQQLGNAYWDLVILDINMPDRSGLDILREIRAGYPNTSVLVLSGFADKQYAISMLRAGVAGYLAKDQAPEEFTRAVSTILAGARFISAPLSQITLTTLDEPTDEPLHASFSQREFQILCKLAVGRSVTQIADDLFISTKKVSTYRIRLLEKMHLETNAELTMYALRNGLVH